MRLKLRVAADPTSPATNTSASRSIADVYQLAAEASHAPLSVGISVIFSLTIASARKSPENSTKHAACSLVDRDRGHLTLARDLTQEENANYRLAE
jgi:hypothetical protein